MNRKKQVLSLLSMLSLIGSSACLQAMFKYSKAAPTTKSSPAPKNNNVIDVPEVMESNQTSTELLDSHAQAMKQTSQQSLYSSVFGSKEKVTPASVEEDDNAIDFDSNNTASVNSDNSSLNLGSQAAKVTPAAYLTSILKESDLGGVNYKRALLQLDDQLDKKGNDPSQQQLIQQARTLLVRAHPELVPGLTQKLAYLPNRFMSYVKEKMPTLSTAAGKQRFTQSVVMETLKDMPEFDSNEFADKLDEITNKYANDLTSISNLKTTDPSFAQMSMQWSRNLVSDIALVAYTAGKTTAMATGKAAAMTTGAAVGAGIGAAVGSVSGAGNGLAIGGIIGSYAGSGTEMDDGLAARFNELENHSGFSGGVAGGMIGGAAGNPARLIGLGSTVGGIAGAGAGAGLGAATGGIGSAISGAQYGAQAGALAFDAAGRAVTGAARSAYNQGARLFQTKLTKANLDIASGSFDKQEYVGSEKASASSDTNTESQLFKHVSGVTGLNSSRLLVRNTSMNSNDQTTGGWNTYPDSDTASVESNFVESPTRSRNNSTNSIGSADSNDSVESSYVQVNTPNEIHI